MKNKILVITIFSILFFSTCQKDDSLYELAPANPDKQILISLINETRLKGCNCGNDYFPPVNPIKWNDTLELAAKEHSNDMKDNNYFDHKGNDGSSVGDRINKYSYKWSTCGENIAKGYSTEQKVIKGWIDSPGHCRNIMNGNFKEVAVATKGAYWTQVFATH